MTRFDGKQSKQTLETLISRVHEEIGGSISRMALIVGEIPDDISKFFQGKLDWGEFHVVYHAKGEALDYGDLIEKAKPLFEQAKATWLEKGYRYAGALLTAREHKEVGSSGYGLYMAMPDTVVQIAEQTLKLSKSVGKEPMTIEEIRRARILAGMTAIDDTGTVTGEAVPITDSYHFLPEERKAEVKRLERRIISGLRRIVNEAVTRKVIALTKYEAVVKILAEGKIYRTDVDAQLAGLGLMSIDAVTEASQLSYQNGHRDDILTPMEIRLLGRKVDEQYRSKPYTPLGVQNRTLSIEAANADRLKEQYFDVETALFSGYKYPVALSLEPLNAEGKTERGPLVLHHQTKEPLSEAMIELWRGSARRIPFSRPIDWYHKATAAKSS